MPNGMQIDQSSSSLPPHLANSETNVANGFAAEAEFSFSQDFGLGDLFELVVQCGLQHADVEDSLAQRYRSRMRGNEVAYDF
jgi:hypothetical protein